MQTHKPPTLFRLFLSLLDLRRDTALPLLRTETAAPPTVANTFDVATTKVTRVASEGIDDSASEIELARFHAFRLCRLLRSRTDVSIRRCLSRLTFVPESYPRIDREATQALTSKCVAWIENRRFKRLAPSCRG